MRSQTVKDPKEFGHEKTRDASHSEVGGRGWPRKCRGTRAAQNLCRTYPM